MGPIRQKGTQDLSSSHWAWRFARRRVARRHEGKVVVFFALTFAVKGCRRKIVDAAVAATPKEWQMVVLFTWSGSFWGRMAEEPPRLMVV